MSGSRIKATAQGLLAVIALSSAGIYFSYSQVSRQHPVQMACSECHLAGAETKADNAHLLTSDQQALCARCHKGAIEASHPSGFQPGRSLPADYPLDWKGDLTCSTCHQAHGTTPGLMRGARSGKDLCLSCHDKTFFTAMRDHGTSIMLSGHLDAGAFRDPNVLDPYSMQCMECHVKEADNIRIQVSRSGVLRHAGKSLNHPIGQVYAKYLSYGGFAQPASLPKMILLPEGRVSCVSCHQGFTEKHGELAISNKGSALCFSCHRL